MAGNWFCLLRKAIVRAQLLTLLDGTSTEEQNMSMQLPWPQIWLAGVVDELGAASSYGSIYHPIAIDPRQINKLPARRIGHSSGTL